jgi:hypothetical protein
MLLYKGKMHQVNIPSMQVMKHTVLVVQKTKYLMENMSVELMLIDRSGKKNQSSRVLVLLQVRTVCHIQQSEGFSVKASNFTCNSNKL